MDIKVDMKKPNCIELSKDATVFSDDYSLTTKILEKNQKLVAIFGGSCISEDSIYFQKAKEFAGLISASGVSIITGGGPGIMQAGNMGAKSSNSSVASYGLRVDAIKDECIAENPYIDEDCEFTFNTLSVRLLTLIGSSDAIVLFPGGFGTLEELFSLLVRLRVGMMKKVPVYLFGSEFWSGLINWLSTVVLQNKTISEQDLKLFKIEDDIEKISTEIISLLKCSN